jgi:hypothetical protein
VSEDDEHSISYLALPSGVPVLSSDGVEIGTVHERSTTPANTSSTAS